jgi:hypothetical protein
MINGRTNEQWMGLLYALFSDDPRKFWAGHAIAKVVCRWLPTAAARVRARSGQMGFVVNNVALMISTLSVPRCYKQEKSRVE